MLPVRSDERMRWLALLWVLLFGITMTAQAAHVHRPCSPGHRVQVSSACAQSGVDTEEHCSLCVAAHSALPSVLQAQMAGTLVPVQAHWPPTQGKAVADWHFAAFGRPPPACA